MRVDVGKVLSDSQLLQRSSQNNKPTSVQDGKATEVKWEDEGREQGAIEVQEEKEVDKDQAKKIVAGLNDFLKPTSTSIQFNFHEKLEEYYVSIVDKDTKEVIKEIPPKKLLDIYAAMAESLGFIVDKRI